MINKQFLSVIFGSFADQVHVTDFTFDPNHIPQNKALSAWKGDTFSRYKFHENDANQYFCVSVFKRDSDNIARRRKSLFISTHIIVLDDVREKLSIDAVKLLPLPSYILETSPGSEQWGYILNTPCDDRSKIENLFVSLSLFIT